MQIGIARGLAPHLVAALLTPFRLLSGAVHTFEAHFLLGWSLLLALIVLGGLYFAKQIPSKLSSGRANYRDVAAPGIFDRLSVALSFLFLSAYCYLVFYKEAFLYYDDDMLTEFSLRGKSFAPPIWPDTGRFYPLADQEFNFLQHFTRSPFGYHAIVVAELLALVCILYLVLGEFRVRYRVVILVCAMALPSVMIPFFGFVYPERNVLFWLAVLIFCLQRYDQTGGKAYFIGSLIATHCALYYKELVILFVGIFAITRIGLDLREARTTARSWMDVAKDNLVPLGMLVVCSIYVGLFLLAMVPHHQFSYIAEHQQTLAETLWVYLKIDWLPFLMLAVFLARLASWLREGFVLDPVWDPLAAGALAYGGALIVLKLVSGYYMAPVDVTALLYLAFISLRWASVPGRADRGWVTGVTAALVFLQAFAYSSFRVIERKNMITTKSQLVEFLRGYQQQAPAGRIELFFPYATGYHLMGLASYLNYEGFHLAGEADDPADNSPKLAIESPRNLTDERCVPYRNYSCFHVKRPSPGALIVVLPDDEVSALELETLEKQSSRVLSINGSVMAPGTSLELRPLHAISAEFSSRELPDHWLQLDVLKQN